MRIDKRKNKWSFRTPSGKLLEAWKEKDGSFTVGVQGTSDWFKCNNKEEVEEKINELYNKKYPF